MINLTQHDPTPDQAEAGVRKPFLKKLGQLDLLNFETLEEAFSAHERAEKIAHLVETSVGPEEIEVLIGGAPFLMGHLAFELKKRGFVPVYAFSVRESVDQAMPDGSTRKVSVFRHGGFVPAYHSGIPFSASAYREQPATFTSLSPGFTVISRQCWNDMRE